MLKRAFPILCRKLSQNVPVAKELPKMKSWQIHEYGDLEILQLGNARLPVIGSPSKVLVKVKAASLNPIDLYMIGKEHFLIEVNDNSAEILFVLRWIWKNIISNSANE